MDFEQKKRRPANENNYHLENLKIAREYSKSLILEMKELVKSIVLFGSNTHNTLNKNSDIDLMIVLDNVSVFVSPELREAYRVITDNLTKETSSKLHIMTVNLSELWDMARKGDPVLINILRFGVPLFDRDLIEPMQYLLEIGKIRPTREAVYNYMARSQTLLEETNKHLHNATLDLYYAIIDIVHATLILEKIMPPSPKEMPKIFAKTFKKTPLEKYSKEIEEFYSIAKKLEYGKLTEISGKEFESLQKKATKLIETLKKYNEKKLKETDIFEI